MKYTKEERLNIGRRIYDGEVSRYEAKLGYKLGYIAFSALGIVTFSVKARRKIRKWL